MPLIIPANTLSGDYEIDNSLRLDSASSAYLYRNQVDPTQEGQIYTISVWNKICFPDGQNATLLTGGYPSGSGSSVEETFFMHNVTNKTIFFQNASNDSTVLGKHTAGKYRDVSAWYHFMLSVDTTQGTDTNRLKVYVNGENVSADMTGGWPVQNVIHQLNQEFSDSSNQNTHNIGKETRGSNYSDMYIADFAFVDGTQLTPSSFGETDEDSGIWKPKKPSVTWGDNGFFLEFKQTGTGTAGSGTVGADTSGNDNHFTSSGIASTDITTDTPTNNFCTMNPLDNYYQGGTFSEGNCKVVTGDAGNTAHSATMGVANGKWYFEAKLSAQSGSGTNAAFVGILGRLAINNTQYVGGMTDAYGIDSRSGKIYHGSDSGTSFGDAYSTGAIISCAFDLDNNKLYFAENGTWKNSSDPAAGSNGHSITAAASTQDGFYLPAVSDVGSDNQATWEMNFGNPSFAISSGNADDNGYGNFEYDVPAGFYALCTKNLAEFG